MVTRLRQPVRRSLTREWDALPAVTHQMNDDASACRHANTGLLITPPIDQDLPLHAAEKRRICLDCMAVLEAEA